MRRAWGIGSIGFAGLAAWAGAAAWLDHVGGAPPPPGPYDYVVVAGAGVLPGGAPSATLSARTRRAVELWNAGVAPRIAFTGGVGDWGPAESAVAADLAERLGVPRDAMVAEASSTSTEENARDLRGVVGSARVLVVTDRYHVVRCRRVFARWFPEVEAVGVETSPVVRARGALREVLAVGWYGLRGRL